MLLNYSRQNGNCFIHLKNCIFFWKIFLTAYSITKIGGVKSNENILFHEIILPFPLCLVWMGWRWDWQGKPWWSALIRAVRLFIHLVVFIGHYLFSRHQARLMHLNWKQWGESGFHILLDSYIPLVVVGDWLRAT